MSIVRFASYILLLVAVTGCAAAPDSTPAPVADQAPPIEGVSVVSTLPVPNQEPGSSSGWRDLEAVNLCALIHNKDVATLFGAEPTRGDLEGVTGPNCTYQITPDGGDTVHNIYVYLFGEDVVDVSLMLARDSGGEVVAGLGDESYLYFDEADQQYHLAGVRQGDFGFEITAPDDEGALRLAELILERL